MGNCNIINDTFTTTILSYIEYKNRATLYCHTYTIVVVKIKLINRLITF